MVVGAFAQTGVGGEGQQRLGEQDEDERRREAGAVWGVLQIEKACHPVDPGFDLWEELPMILRTSSCNTPHSSMRALYQARDSLEARLLADRLAAAHIETVILGEHLVGGAGELSAVNFPVVWIVDANDLARAQALLEIFLAEQRQEPSGPGWRCPTCEAEVDPGFERCWNCGRERPE
jgi:hypothetical protein